MNIEFVYCCVYIKKVLEVENTICFIELRRDHIDGVLCTSEARCSLHNAPIITRDYIRKEQRCNSRNELRGGRHQCGPYEIRGIGERGNEVTFIR